jgi:hypothetical protein
MNKTALLLAHNTLIQTVVLTLMVFSSVLFIRCVLQYKNELKTWSATNNDAPKPQFPLARYLASGTFLALLAQIGSTLNYSG